ncbi:MAG: DUF4234 domain-containing protein [candidate division Zixibacteria bacterium]|nr:DUF4234 domain-containing protein [candidate division Zixibacteria bacterium]
MQTQSGVQANAQANVKYREMWIQVVLVIVTLGIYVIYWFYQTVTEIKGLAGDTEISPTLLTVLLFVPFGAIYSHYKYGEVFEKISSERLNRWILFLLWLFFSPAVWFIVQTELNKRATYGWPSQT